MRTLSYPLRTLSVSRTRFAPAPTGFLHLGHVLNAHHVWTTAARHGAEVLLRIEDHDRERCRPEYERAILDDLDWLGFAPGVYPTSAFRSGPCESRQSERHAVYVEAAQMLEARGLLYGCTCTRQEIAAAPGAGNSILTITAGSNVAVGSYPLTVTATDSTGAPIHSSTVTLKVQ